MENVKRIDFQTCLHNSDGEPIKGTECSHTILFNTTVISVEEARTLIDFGEWEWDQRVIATTPSRADALKGIF